MNKYIIYYIYNGDRLSKFTYSTDIALALASFIEQQYCTLADIMCIEQVHEFNMY